MMGPSDSKVIYTVRKALEGLGINRERAQEEAETVANDLKRLEKYFDLVEEEAGL